MSSYKIRKVKINNNLMMKPEKIQNFFYKLVHSSDFYDAIHRKNSTRLKELCEENKKSIDAYYADRTPLQHCILSQFDEGIIELLKNGANPNLSCKRFLGKSTLEDALTWSTPNVSLIRLLGFYGANPPSNTNYLNSEVIKEAYWQGRNVFLKKESITKLIGSESNPIFKAHYSEIANLHIHINSSKNAATETASLLKHSIS